MINQRWPNWQAFILSSWPGWAIIVLLAMLAAGIFYSGSLFPGHYAHPQTPPRNCGLANPAFCSTFDSASPVTNRSGQLDGTVWGVSRTTGNMNFPDPANGWSPTTLQACGRTLSVQPPNDVQICNGQLVEATNDHETVTTLAIYPKQPFDFAGRTGKIVFDVSDDSGGTHAAWPELWLTNKPVPAPFAHEESWIALPQNGFGIRFAGYSSNSCPEGPGYVGVDSAIVINNWVKNDSFSGGTLQVNGLGCVKQPTAPGQLNHFEVDVSQGTIDVYGTDAGTTAPLKHLSQIPNAGLSLTRGLVWIEDVHYNGDKSPALQRTHTFVWDNVGFDGPTLPRDLTFDVLDNTTVNGDGTINLGWLIAPGDIHVFTIPAVTGIAQASAGYILMNFWMEVAPLQITYSLNNGPSHTQAWPYPDTQAFGFRTIAMPIAPTEAVAGANTLNISASEAIIAANLDLLLVDAGGVHPCDCGNGTPTPTPTPTPTATPPTWTCTERTYSTGIPTAVCNTTGTVPTPDPARTPAAVCTETFPPAVVPTSSCSGVGPSGPVRR